MVPVDPALRPEAFLRKALDILGQGVHCEAFVIDESGRPLGLISTQEILNDASVISAMRPDGVTAAPDTPVVLMRTCMRRARIRKVLICEGNRVLGQVAADRVDREG